MKNAFNFSVWIWRVRCFSLLLIVDREWFAKSKEKSSFVQSIFKDGIWNLHAFSVVCDPEESAFPVQNRQNRNGFCILLFFMKTDAFLTRFQRVIFITFSSFLRLPLAAISDSIVSCAEVVFFYFLRSFPASFADRYRY